MKLLNKKLGFTLIELLVVVAIIGVLASVILSSLGGARTRAADTALKTNIDTVKKQAEIFYLENGSYLPPGGTIFQAYCGNSNYINYDPNGTNMFTSDKIINDALLEAGKNAYKGRGSVPDCHNSSNAWVVAMKLKSDSGKVWCVDSSGYSDIINLVDFNWGGTACK